MTVYTPFESRDALIAELVKFSEAALRQGLDKHGRAVMAVPGGTTPAPFFETLRKSDLDWAKVSIMLTDERFVPETSDRSNTRLLRESLFKDNAAHANLVPFYKQAASPEDVIAELTDGIKPHLPLDLVILGMGTDMHTASIFPEADLLAEALDADAPALLPMRAAGAPEPRLTLTAPVLQSAKAKALLLMGEGKIAPLETALGDGSAIEAPVRIVLHGPNPAKIFYAA